MPRVTVLMWGEKKKHNSPFGTEVVITSGCAMSIVRIVFT